jgi:hypothetical protein
MFELCLNANKYDVAMANPEDLEGVISVLFDTKKGARTDFPFPSGTQSQINALALRHSIPAR